QSRLPLRPSRVNFTMATNITSGWLRTQSVVAMNRLDIYIHRALDRPIPDDNSHPLDVKKYIRETEKDITTAKNSIDRIWELHGHWNNLIDSTSKANRAQEEACRDELFGPAGKPNIEARTIAVEDSLAELESRVADAKDLQNQLTTKPLIIAQEQPTIPASA
uniref:Seryl_tRNA_N domain-containing protein n=1 Tax=Panagrellus redivivus TaxID=6233 RepID=A0A7E4VRG1_PANRE